MSTIMGSGDFRYEAQDGWAQLPDGMTFKEVAGVGVDGNDNVYCFTRGEHPMIVFDKDGQFLRTWGEGVELTRFGGHLNCAQEVSECRGNVRRSRRNTGSRWLSWYAGVAGQRSWLGSSSVRLQRFGTGCGKRIGTRVLVRTA